MTQMKFCTKKLEIPADDIMTHTLHSTCCCTSATQLFVSDTQARVGIPFEKRMFLTNSVYAKITQEVWCMSFPLILQKGVIVPPNKASQFMLQLNYTPTSFHAMLDFQGKTFDLFDKYSPFYHYSGTVQGNEVRNSHQNTNRNILCLSPSQTITYLHCRLKNCSFPWYAMKKSIPYMQNYTFIPDGILHDTLSLETVQNASTNEGDLLPHLAVWSDAYINETNRMIWGMINIHD